MKIRLGDIDVDYRTTGAGDPVVMVHGLAEDAGSWADVQARLPGFATYAYDLRGHGNTDLGQAEGTLAQLGGDLIRFLEEVTGPAACVGYSLGGTVVLWVATQRPDLVRRAVVIGTSTVVGSAAAGFFHGRMALLESDFEAFSTALADDTAKQILSPDADFAEVAARRLRAVGNGGGYINAARAMARLNGEPLTPRLAEIACGVDVIGGSGDVFCPRKAADIILEHLADGRYHEIAGAGHLISIDKPVEYAGAIESALQRRD